MLEKFNLETLKGFRWTLGWSWQRRFGFEYSRVEHHGSPYLSRWIVYLGGGTLRLHKFWRGDDDRAPHTHPWWFITIPLRWYVEDVYENGVFQEERYVRPFWPHFRKATFEHIVKYGVGYYRSKTNRAWDGWCIDRRPFYTIVISGERTNGWGFYPKPGEFVPWRNFIHTYESKQ